MTTTSNRFGSAIPTRRRTRCARTRQDMGAPPFAIDPATRPLARRGNLLIDIL
jgi:hypothetical protein